MTIEDLNRIHEIDTELLLEVDRICARYNLKYFLFYGTLLGAIRHSGPIPWDDDVDVCMFRSDYLKFISIAEKELDKSNYIFKIMGSGSPDYLSEIKIGKKNTLYCAPGCENLDIMKNVQIDIFCLDHIKFKSKKEYILRQTIWRYLRLCKLSGDEKKLLHIVIKKSTHRLKWLYHVGLYFLHFLRFCIGEKSLERIGYYLIVDRDNKSKKLAVVDGFPFCWDEGDFNSIRLSEYDGYEFPIPVGYNNILTEVYGDFMQYPPEDKRYKKDFASLIFKEL